MDGSLGPAFATRIVVGLIRVKPPFPLAVYTRFLTWLRRPLGTLDIFLSVWRPTQTAHLPMSSGDPELVIRHKKGGVSLLPPPELAPGLRRLPPTLHIKYRMTTTGCSKALWGLRFLLECTGLCASKVDFTGLQAGTVELSLGHSCKPPIKRQGITLP